MTRLNDVERAALEDLFSTLSSNTILLRLINSVKTIFNLR